MKIKKIRYVERYNETEGTIDFSYNGFDVDAEGALTEYALFSAATECAKSYYNQRDNEWYEGEIILNLFVDENLVGTYEVGIEFSTPTFEVSRVEVTA